jgi:hypothetical protein
MLYLLRLLAHISTSPPLAIPHLVTLAEDDHYM